MPNCEGRSRRCGVILIYCADNGYFVAYTSLPPTAEPLLKEKPFGGHSVQLSLVAELVCHTQPTSPWHADFNRRGLAKPDHRGKMKNRPGGVYSRPSDSSFSLPRGAAVPPSSFINLTFTSQRSLLWYFLGLQESTVPLVPPFVPPRPPSPRKFRLPFAANCGNIKAITHWRCLRCRIRFCNRFRAPCRRILRT